MSFNYAGTQATVASTIQTYGQSIAFTRAGKSLFKCFGVFDMAKKQGENTTPAISGISTSVVQTIIVYIPGTVKSLPLPNDTVDRAGAIYRVKSVEVIRPATLTLAYMLELE